MSEPTLVHRQTGAGAVKEEDRSAPGEPYSRVTTFLEVTVDTIDGQRFDFVGYSQQLTDRDESISHSVAIGPGGVLQVVYRHELPSGAARIRVARTFSPNYWTNASGPHHGWMTDAEFQPYE